MFIFDIIAVILVGSFALSVVLQVNNDVENKTAIERNAVTYVGIVVAVCIFIIWRIIS